MQLFAETKFDDALAELQAVSRGEIRPDPCDLLELAIELFVSREFSLQARIARARKQHRRVRRLVHHQKLIKAAELAA